MPQPPSVPTTAGSWAAVYEKEKKVGRGGLGTTLSACSQKEQAENPPTKQQPPGGEGLDAPSSHRLDFLPPPARGQGAGPCSSRSAPKALRSPAPHCASISRSSRSSESVASPDGAPGPGLGSPPPSNGKLDQDDVIGGLGQDGVIEPSKKKEGPTLSRKETCPGSRRRDWPVEKKKGQLPPKEDLQGSSLSSPKLVDCEKKPTPKPESQAANPHPAGSFKIK